jgi:hypothetical protein
VLSPVAGGAALFTQTGATLAGTSGASITTLRISDYGTGSSADGSKEFFFDDLMITAPAVAGDLNQDGSVNAADYVFWRKTDVSPNNYYTWRENFSHPSDAGDSLNVLQAWTVPEPASAFLLAASFIACIAAPKLLRSQRRKRK